MVAERAQRLGIQCEWVPGTMDRVWVHLPNHDLEVSLEQLQRVAGVDAVWELYLKGLVTLPSRPEFFEAFEKL
ncbi:hypothetical protein Mlute_00791 [Meiothermus luteus]|mgnify:CR=1 FL=1|jgi:hypothetical protein|uniref:Uncharacterized protein n=1 Tax=Meiothermus luteus TaxID=2026184 RepID=A0A399EV47_9DEIN|nr:hypothetical protein [Meiothermus luteus]RIH87918.1 hypothetical protein Mlute_00791 [Meiothermus luteus]RMH54882.1 MAG: hypothetical protein D6684_08825 [Deinococcota bacterium]